MPEAQFVDRLRGVFIPVTTNFDAVTGEVAPVSFRENLRKYKAMPLPELITLGLAVTVVFVVLQGVLLGGEAPAVPK